MADFTEIGRQAYRDGLSHVIADNPVMRDLWPSVPAAQHRQVIRDYADGWAAEQRETNPAEALAAEVAKTERQIEWLSGQIAKTTHARHLARLKRDRDEARARLAQLRQEQGRCAGEPLDEIDRYNAAIAPTIRRIANNGRKHAIQGLTIDAEETP